MLYKEIRIQYIFSSPCRTEARLLSPPLTLLFIYVKMFVFFNVIYNILIRKKKASSSRKLENCSFWLGTVVDGQEKCVLWDVQMLGPRIGSSQWRFVGPETGLQESQAFPCEEFCERKALDGPWRCIIPFHNINTSFTFSFPSLYYSVSSFTKCFHLFIYLFSPFFIELKCRGSCNNALYN